MKLQHRHTMIWGFLFCSIGLYILLMTGLYKSINAHTLTSTPCESTLALAPTFEPLALNPAATIVVATHQMPIVINPCNTLTPSASSLTPIASSTVLSSGVIAPQSTEESLNSVLLVTPFPKFESLVSPTTIVYPDFSYGNGNNVPGLNVVGSASVPTGTKVLRLSSSSPCCQVGSAWYTTKMNISQGFQTLFQVKLSDSVGVRGGGDGFAFVIQNSSANAIGGAGCGLGYDGIPKSIAIEFDHFVNPPFCESTNDPAWRHVSIHTQGVNPNSVIHTNGDSVQISMVDDIHTIKIEYIPPPTEISPAKLKVYYDNNIVPILEQSIDISQLGILDNGQAWVGFTGSTGTEVVTQDILNWEFASSEQHINTLDPLEGPLPVTVGDYSLTPQYMPDVLDSFYPDVNLIKEYPSIGNPPPGFVAPLHYPIELKARVYRPANLEDKQYPLIVILHGNHDTCGTGTPRVDAGLAAAYTFYHECPTPFVEAPSEQGYEYLAVPLASWGYIVISINTNLTINANPFFNSADQPNYTQDRYLIETRGRLILKHLQQWYEWSQNGMFPISVGGTSLQGKIDFTNVGLLGHSRGGEGVRAAYNIYYEENPNYWSPLIPGLVIKAIFEIAPTDLVAPDGTISRNGDGTVWGVLLPNCDGDARDLSGINVFDRLVNRQDPHQVVIGTNKTPEAHGTHKIAYKVYGANHNFYNTEWHSSDSPGCTGPFQLFTVSAQVTESITQQQTAQSSVLALFRGNVGEKAAYQFNLALNPLVSIPTPVITQIERNYIPSANNSLNASTSSGQNQYALLFDDFENTTNTRTISSFAFGSTVVLHDDVFTRTGFARHNLIPDQRAYVLGWYTNNQTFTTDWGSNKDISQYSTLDIRLVRIKETSLNSTLFTNFYVSLVDNNGNQSVPISIDQYIVLQNSYGASAPISTENTILQTIRIPLTAFYAPGVSISAFTSLRKITFSFGDTPQGLIYIADIRFSRQTGGVPLLPLQAQFTKFELPNNNVALSNETLTLPNLNVMLSSNLPFTSRSLILTVTPSTSVSMTATPSQSKGVKLELYTPNGFPLKNYSIGDLYIGKLRFEIGISGLPKTIVDIDASSWSLLHDSDEVTLSYGSKMYYFGFLDKQNPHLREQFLLRKQALISELNEIIASLRSTSGKDTLESAVTLLETSTAPKYWLDGAYLNTSQGADVFDLDSQIATLLLQASDEIPDDTAENHTLRGILYWLVTEELLDIDLGLAIQAKQEAVTKQASQREIDQINDQMIYALDNTRRDPALAISFYKVAWQLALKASSGK